MPAKIFSLCSNNLTKPFANMRVVYIVIVNPTLIACIIWRINIDAIYLPFIFWQQGFQGFKVVTMNYFVATVGLRGISRIIPPIPVFVFQHPERYFRMMVYNLIFSYPV